MNRNGQKWNKTYRIGRKQTETDRNERKQKKTDSKDRNGQKRTETPYLDNVSSLAKLSQVYPSLAKFSQG